MQGYIIDIRSVKDEDLIVTILTDDFVYTAYRFYGARHSTINIGYKIDFELESNLKSNLPRLKDVLHLGSSWLHDRQKMYCWQSFIKLFHPHLRGLESVDNGYFAILDMLTHKLIKQNPKRAIIEAYFNILELEGRLHTQMHCFLCESTIENRVSIVRGFLPTHPACSYSKSFSKQKIQKLFQQKLLIHLDDEEVDYLWNIVLQGL